MGSTNSALTELASKLHASDPEEFESAALAIYLLFERERRVDADISSGNRVIYKQYLPAEFQRMRLSDSEHAWLVGRVLDRLDEDPPSDSLVGSLRYADGEVAAHRYLEIVTRRSLSWGRNGLIHIASTLYQYFHCRPNRKWSVDAASILRCCDTEALLKRFFESNDEDLREDGEAVERAFLRYGLRSPGKPDRE